MSDSGDNPYQVPGTPLEKKQDDSLQKRSVGWLVFLFFYISYPVMTSFVIPKFKLFSYGEYEFSIQVPSYLNWFDHISWVFLGVISIGILVFKFNWRLLARDVWVGVFWLGLTYAVAAYGYAMYRDYTISYTSNPQTVDYLLMLANTLIKLSLNAPSLYAIYHYAHKSPWVWRNAKA